MRSCKLFVLIAMWIFFPCSWDVIPGAETDAIPQLARIFPDKDDSKQQFAGCNAYTLRLSRSALGHDPRQTERRVGKSEVLYVSSHALSV